jgi:hypothetical protein
MDAKYDFSNSVNISSNVIRSPGQFNLNFPEATSPSRFFQILVARFFEVVLADSKTCSPSAIYDIHQYGDRRFL